MYQIFRQLCIASKQRRIVICEDLLMPRNFREALADVVFNVLKVYIYINTKIKTSSGRVTFFIFVVCVSILGKASSTCSGYDNIFVCNMSRNCVDY